LVIYTTASSDGFSLRLCNIGQDIMFVVSVGTSATDGRQCASLGEIGTLKN